MNCESYPLYSRMEAIDTKRANPVQETAIGSEPESRSKKCLACDAVVERAVESCSKCGAKVEPDVRTVPYKEKQSFAAYVDSSATLGKEMYEELIQALSQIDRRERPWCGVGVKADILSVSPTGVTVAVIGEPSGIKKGIVRVAANWREPWEVESLEGKRHHLQSNPCEKAERAIGAVKSSLKSLLKADEEPIFPSVKCLIIFPDGYDFKGPKEFSILEPDEVVTLRLRNIRDLPEAIVRPSQGKELDSRKYRKWIEGLVRSKDDSILGTWLDPAFDPAEPEPPKSRLWRLGHPRPQQVPAGEEEPRPSHRSPTRAIQTNFTGRRLKLALMLLAGILIVMMGWRVNGVVKPAASSPAVKNSPAAPKVAQTAPPQDLPSANELEEEEVAAAPEPVESQEPQTPTAAKNDPVSRSANKSEAARTPAPGDSEAKRRKIEVQIRDAIRRRAIRGVRVSFVGETAYLEGQVETENQKSAAEKAARSVPRVKEIRNSIELSPFSPADG